MRELLEKRPCPKRETEGLPKICGCHLSRGGAGEQGGKNLPLEAYFIGRTKSSKLMQKYMPM